MRRAVAATVAGLALAGCAAAPGTSSIGAATVVVGSARTGSPAPGWNDELELRFRTDLDRRAAWTFVSVDGRPTVVGSLDLVVLGDNDLVLGDAVDGRRAQAEGLVAAARADDPEADVLAALTLAGRVLADRSGDRTILLHDSLLQTAGALRFQDRDGALLSADPGAVVDLLATSGNLPSLDGVEVVVLGAGDTVAPQENLPPPVRTALIGLWRAILERAGATVRVDERPVPARTADGLPPVTPVAVGLPPVDVPVDTPIVLHDSSVGFLPDQALLRDPALAASVLEPVAERLRAGGVRVRLSGTTSSAGTPEGRLALSRDRAAAVAALLRAAGVPTELLEVRGVGTDFPGFVPDRDGAGRLDPVLAAANRQVIIESGPADGPGRS